MADLKYALVFGASGVTGWAVVNAILADRPAKGVWGGVIALTNRPLSREAACWPADERLTIVSGVDLLGSQDELEAALGKIQGIERVTDALYFAYKASTDTAAEVRDNTAMLQRAVVAADRLCPRLGLFVLQTGSKQYGCHLLGGRPDYVQPPLAETTPPLAPPHDAGLFYPAQMAFLTEYAAARPWGWLDTRPDIVVGFVPHPNFFSLASSLGVFLSLFRALHGAGAACPFPGTPRSWATRSNDSSAEMIARQTLFLAADPRWRAAKGAAFNVADARAPVANAARWPVLCAYFGLVGTAPTGDTPVDVRQYIRDHLDTWTALERAHGLRPGFADSPRVFPGFEHALLVLFEYDRHYDMAKLYDEAGFTEEHDTATAWGLVFDRMRAAKILPTFA